jgi:alkanesulfonate monooxygenase SsuD/methylene tetrahydromethanopterin reductase-like flavin-dependent oxidoreductase (luciferase family)
VTVRLGWDRPVTGSPEAVAEQVQNRVIDGVIVNMPPQGHLPGFITKAGEVLKPLVGA